MFYKYIILEFYGCFIILSSWIGKTVVHNTQRRGNTTGTLTKRKDGNPTMQRFTQFLKKRGLLLAAGLCVVAAGVAGVNVVNRMIDSLGAKPQASSLTDTPLSVPQPALPDELQEAPVANPQQGVPVTPQKPADKKPADSTAQEPAVSDPTGPADESAQPTPTETAAPSVVRPVAGAVMADFSGEELLYNTTMDDWRTHNGTDFAAAYGETVCSMTSGTVKAVYEDPLWGWTVEVQSPEGLLRYAGLAHKPAVRQDAAVKAGDALGKLDELYAEIAAEPHLHVEYEKDGKLTDVMSLLAG